MLVLFGSATLLHDLQNATEILDRFIMFPHFIFGHQPTPKESKSAGVTTGLLVIPVESIVKRLPIGRIALLPKI